MSIVLKNAFYYNNDFDKVKGNIVIEGECIKSLPEKYTSKKKDTVYSVGKYLVIPGMIDIHIHGCGGADTNEDTENAIKTMSKTLLKNGITSFCPTSMTLPKETLKEIFVAINKVKDSLPGAYVQGINMEGPYIALSKKGAQNEKYIRNPSIKEFKELYRASGNNIVLVDIAPELKGSERFIKEINPICTVSVAHTDADYDKTVKAFENGVRHITHLYNAQAGLSHRAPGVVGAVFDKSREMNIQSEIICDGFHIHPAALRIAFNVIGEDNSIVISDSMRAADYKDGTYMLGGQEVYVKGGKALLKDGTIAASTSNLLKEFRNLISFGICERQAVKSVTINPARAIRKDNVTGSIKEGKFADLVVLDSAYNVCMVIVKGKVLINLL